MNRNIKRVPQKAVKKKKVSMFGRFVGRLFFFMLFYFMFAAIYLLLLNLRITFRHKEVQSASAGVTIVADIIDADSGKIERIVNPLDFSDAKKAINSRKSAYIPISAFSDMGIDITPAGDPLKSITVNLNQAGESAMFMVNSNKASVNGNDVTLKAESFIHNDDLYIPIDFFETQVQGITVTNLDGDYTVTKSGIENISFVNKPVESTPCINQYDYFTGLPIEFKADLSQYEQYMNPEKRDQYLYVVNVNNMLPQSFVPSDLREVKYTKPDRQKQKMSLYAQMSADAMMIEARKYGFHNLWVTSAYRDYQTQAVLYENEVEQMRAEYGDEFAEQKAMESVNPPGASEHQTGLTADIHSLYSASIKFASTPEAQWLEENAHYFGFILRYPADKTEITGITYEPWHFRFVGRYHAMQMKRLNMCLEEYVEYLDKDFMPE